MKIKKEYMKYFNNKYLIDFGKKYLKITEEEYKKMMNLDVKYVKERYIITEVKEGNACKQWYSSGCKDFSYYGKPDYIAIGHSCFLEASKQAVTKFMDLVKRQKLKINSVVDLGAGTGLTTALIKFFHPEWDVYYHNLEGPQMEYAKYFFKKHNLDIKILKGNKDIKKKYDVFFASEYYEHFKEPIKEVKFILPYINKYLITANSFHQKAYGHFPKYINEDGKEILNKKMEEEFKKFLFNNGFFKSKNHIIWNDRPMIYTKNKTNTKTTEGWIEYSGYKYKIHNKNLLVDNGEEIKTIKNGGEGFKILSNGYSINNHNVFFDFNIIKGLNPNSFEILSNNYIKDDKNIFYNWYGTPLKKNMDVNTFKIIGNGYAKDKHKVIHNGNILDWVDVNSFKYLGNNYYSDKNYIIRNRTPIKEINYDSFKVLGLGYGTDGKVIIYNGKILKDNYDISSFKVGKKEVSDKYGEFKNGKRI